MNSYAISTGIMDLATTASGSVIASLTNPAASGRNVILKNVSAKGDFVGTPGVTRVIININRANGTPAAGSGSKTGSNIPKRAAGCADSIAQFFFGPTPITGLNDLATEGIMKAWSIPSQVGTTVDADLIEDVKNIQETDCIVIVPGTSIVVRLGSISIAGSGAGFDFEWSEQ